jgi:aspartyl-tRNA(Asn)/glutamyl-tRNA(Gln) amidotransferase subunit C
VGIDDAEVRRIAGLAQLELDEPTVATMRRQLQVMLDYVAVLDELDVSGDPVETGPTATRDALRVDETRPGLSRDEALGGAPDAAEGHVRVPRSLPES